LKSAEAEEEDDEVEDEDGSHGLASSSSFAAAAACELCRGGGDRRGSDRRSARVDGIAQSGRLLLRALGFWFAAAGAFP
jgi:hypothetical protein